jgi:hypothetical protein
VNRPECCGRAGTPYRRVYDYGRGGWEEGFRCKRCGAIRLPDVGCLDQAYMNSLAAVREEGMKFDESLSGAR